MAPGDNFTNNSHQIEVVYLFEMANMANNGGFRDNFNE